MGGRTLAIFAAIVAAAVVAIGAGVAQGADPGANHVLRLADLPYGYEIGDDSGCGGLGTEDAPDAVADLAVERRPEGCWVDYERLYRSVYSKPNPPLVVSMALLFDSAEGATEGLAIADQIAEYSIGPIGDKPLHEATSEYDVDVGDAARLFTTEDAVVAGRTGNPGAVLAWRSGRVLAAIFVGGGSGERSVVDSARLLADRQQERIAVPTPIRPKETDDREVALDSPHLDIDVYWLGRRFDPAGKLPGLRLYRGFGPLRRGEGPGNRAWVQYHPSRGLYGVQLGIWRKPAWQRFRRTRLGRLVSGSRCAKRTEIELRHRKAEIISGYAKERKGGGCPDRPFDRFLAHVRFRAVVITVNIPICLRCTERGAPNVDPYNSRRGMAAIARNLKLRRARNFREVG